MVSERNRKLKEYIESLGISVNIGKNKARGNKGFFKYTGNSKYRIDISDSIPEESIFPVLVHEFTHYVHYNYDRTLKKPDFIFENMTDELREELIKVTVEEIPKDFAAALFDEKTRLKVQIRAHETLLKKAFPDFKLSVPYTKLERSIKTPAKYLLKYDRIKISNKIYSVTTLNKDFADLSPEQISYILVKSKQRAVNRINSRISKLNRYYNTPTELIARFMSLYFTDNAKAVRLAPVAASLATEVIRKGKIPEFSAIAKLVK